MLIFCRLRRWIAQVLVGSLLFAQMAVAAHSCAIFMESAPLMHGTVSSAPLNTADASQLDSAQPWGCLAHCHVGQQNSDAKPTPGIPPALVPPAYPLEPISTATLARYLRPASTVTVALGPPHTILHCCYRI